MQYVLHIAKIFNIRPNMSLNISLSKKFLESCFVVTIANNVSSTFSDIKLVV